MTLEETVIFIAQKEQGKATQSAVGDCSASINNPSTPAPPVQHKVGCWACGEHSHGPRARYCGAWSFKCAKCSVKVQLIPIPDDHATLGYPMYDTSKLSSITLPMIADTGCQSSIIHSAHAMGFSKSDIIPVKLVVRGAIMEDLGVAGAVITDVSTDTSGTPCSTRQLIYVGQASAVHKSALVPIHCQEKVHQDLKRDVRLGGLEKVAPTQLTWCSRMVITVKADGTPRRTVDLQVQNRHSVRQTHHVETS
ncbi:hypothetical protein PoB_001073400 [Plakobranchus ocellatus]|uniref:Peptidase A2 domain-containing protein n=1 Tax=Plakobranchus ocellatus TaxID=259542 RepID=A0AAV3YQ26_9GAST|nr:hypothetical protein PoB_001073400 [Plakobranchus ocellatus]